MLTNERLGSVFLMFFQVPSTVTSGFSYCPIIVDLFAKYKISSIHLS